MNKSTSKRNGWDRCWQPTNRHGPFVRFIIQSSRQEKIATIPNCEPLGNRCFDKYKVDLVLQCHDHTYGALVGSTQQSRGSKGATRHRRQCTTGRSAIEPETGTVYVVSVSGPKMYSNTRYSFMKRLAEDTQLYQLIHVEGDTLRFEAKTAVGDLYDAFVLKKQPAKSTS